jgi:hypothetical protein
MQMNLVIVGIQENRLIWNACLPVFRIVKGSGWCIGVHNEKRRKR